MSTKSNVGLFVTSGLILFGLGLFWIGDQRKLFSRGFEVHADFEDLAGLEPGAKVRVAGLDAGEVKSFTVPGNGSSKYQLVARVDRTFRPMIRPDSIARIETDGLVGYKVLEITRGVDPTECQDPCQIMSMKAFDFSDLIGEAKTLVQSTTTTMQNAGSVASNMDRVLTTFLAKNQDGKNGAKDLAETMANAQRAMTNLADDTEALKHNFLFRGFFNHRGFFNLNEMNPAAYRDSDFVKSKESKRVWLDSASLFAKGRGSAEELSKDGQMALDDAMAGFVMYLPNSPIVVEGYSNEGTPDQRFRDSQRRAGQVQDYLLKHYQLKAKYLGTIPLADLPPAKSGKTTWNGVSLALVPAK